MIMMEKMDSKLLKTLLILVIMKLIVIVDLLMEKVYQEKKMFN